MHELNSRKAKARNPFDGAPGFWGRVNRLLYPIAGPASLGAGHPEGAYVPPADPVCPVCGRLMAEHTIVRRADNRSSSLGCPAPQR